MFLNITVRYEAACATKPQQSPINYKGTTNHATEHKLVYEYGRGYGLGDNFVHSSEPVEGREKLLFICFLCGNTKMTEKQHKKAFSYIASQTARYYDEHGTAVASDKNLFDLPED